VSLSREAASRSVTPKFPQIPQNLWTPKVQCVFNGPYSEPDESSPYRARPIKDYSMCQISCQISLSLAVPKNPSKSEASCNTLKDSFCTASCLSHAQLVSWSTIPFLPPATAYWMYSQLPSISGGRLLHQQLEDAPRRGEWGPTYRAVYKFLQTIIATQPSCEELLSSNVYS
jgi:hypothetical protein